MKNTLLNSAAAIAIVCIIGTPSFAADLEQTGYEQTGHDWSGLYVGGHIGYGEASFDGVAFDGSPNSRVFANALDLSGITGGVHGGFNWQIDSKKAGHDIVFGIEGDVTFTHWNDWASQNGTDYISADVDLLVSVRARLGIAFDRTLVFATAGLAYNDAEYSLADPNSTDTVANFDLDHLGGVIGGGIEFAVTDKISFKVEGLYYAFNERISTTTFRSASSRDFVSFDNAFAVNFGLSYKF